MVFTLAASMLVGTPLTASAAGIRGVYSISDGMTDDINNEDPGHSHTGTVTNTNTNSGALQENAAKIIDIVLDKEHVDTVVGKKEILTATVVTEGTLTDERHKDAEQKAIQEALASNIKWEVLNPDGKTTAGANKVLSVAASYDNRTVATLNPRLGTVDGDMIVRAKIDGTYWFEAVTDENGNQVYDENGKPELIKHPVEGGKSYEAKATVFIKQYTDKLVFDGDIATEEVDPLPTAYVKQSLDLNDYIVRKPETANDEITWISTNTKAATVTAKGVVTFKKADLEGSIIAVSEIGANDEWKFKVEAGTPASKIVIMDGTTNKIFTDGKKADNKKASVDIRDDGDWQKDAYVVKYAKVKAAVDDNGDVIPADGAPVINKGKVKSKNVELVSGASYIEVAKDNETITPKAEGSWEVTDTITWTSNKPAIVNFSPDGDEATTYGDEATLYTIGVGTAAITAKASGGKSDKVTVTVKATLTDLTITNTENDLYSGQSLQMTFERKPEENKDGVKWYIAKVAKKDKDGNPVPDKNGDPKMIANPNATINAKGVLTIKPKLDPAYGKVEVVLESKTKPIESVDDKGNKIMVPARDTYPIDISQSSIDKITVTDDDGTPIAAVETTYNNNVGKVAQVKMGAANTTYISVPKDRTYTAIVEASKDVNGEDKYQSGADTLTWTTSNAKVASIEYDGGTAKITAKSSGTATITVSGIRAVNQTKNGVTSLKSASVIKTTFKVSVKQPVKTVTLNKPSVVLNEKVNKKGTQDQKVALKATLGPKGVGKKELVYWSVKQTAGVDHSEALKNEVSLGLKNKKGAEITTANISVTLPQPQVGDVFEITARTDSGASATSVVTIVEKTNDVVIHNDKGVAFEEYDYKPDGSIKKTYKNTKWLTPGGSAHLDGSTHMNTKIGVKVDNGVDYKEAGSKNREEVTYTVNKKGIVRVDDNGNVYALKAGTVKITVKAPLSKKTATLTVVVK